MSQLTMAAMSSEGFSAEPAYDGQRITLRLRGSAELGARELLVQLLAALHADAVRLRAPGVAVDFRELEFMNSSCFKSFVTWLNEVQGLPPEQQYRVHFLSNPQFRWQRASLHALSCFAVDLVKIEGLG